MTSKGGLDPALRRVRAAFGRATAAPVNVIAIGDSITTGFNATTRQQRWTHLLRRSPQARYGGHGEGYLPIICGEGDYPERWLDPWTRRGGRFVPAGLGMRAWQGAGDDVATVSFYGDRCWLLYSSMPDTRKMAVRVDGADVVIDATPVSPDAAARHALRWDSGPLTRGAHTLSVAPYADDPTAEIVVEGVMVFDADSGSGVRFWECAHPGYGAISYADPPSVPLWADALEFIDPQLAIIMLGVNDYGVGRSADEVKTDLGRVIDTLNARVALQPSVLLVAIPSPGNIAEPVWPPYRDAMAALASERSEQVCFLDLETWFGDLHLDTDGLTVDGVHPSDSGSALIAEAVESLLVAPGSGTIVPPMPLEFALTGDFAGIQPKVDPMLAGQVVAETSTMAIDVQVSATMVGVSHGGIHLIHGRNLPQGSRMWDGTVFSSVPGVTWTEIGSIWGDSSGHAGRRIVLHDLVPGDAVRFELRYCVIGYCEQTSIGADTDPSGIAVAPDNSTAWVALRATGEVVPVGLGRSFADHKNKPGSPIWTTPDANSAAAPSRLAMNPDGTRLFVCNQTAESIGVIDTAQAELVSCLPLPAGFRPADCAVTPDARQLYVLAASGALARIDLSSGDVSVDVRQPGEARAIAISPAGDKVYFTVDDTLVEVIAAAPGSSRHADTVERAPLKVGAGATGLAVDSNGSALWVAVHDENLVKQVNLETFAVDPEGAAVVAAPRWLAMDVEDATVFVAGDAAPPEASFHYFSTADAIVYDKQPMGPMGDIALSSDSYIYMSRPTATNGGTAPTSGGELFVFHGGTLYVRAENHFWNEFAQVHVTHLR